MDNERELAQCKTRDVDNSKNILKQDESNIKKLVNDDKKDASTNASNSHIIPNKTRITIKKKLKVTFEKNIDIVKVDSYKKYNIENAFEEPAGGVKLDKPEQYHCKCYIF
jgi:hypothetical protein